MGRSLQPGDSHFTPLSKQNISNINKAKEAGEEVKDAANDAADKLKETAKEVKDVVKD